MSKILRASLRLTAISALLATGVAIAQNAPSNISRLKLASSANSIAAGVAAAQSALVPGDFENSGSVYTGRIACERGSQVVITPLDTPNQYKIEAKGRIFQMVFIPTTTGAVRLEDARNKAVWIQASTKSMLFDNASGLRIADECRSAAQLQAANSTTPSSANLFSRN